MNKDPSNFDPIDSQTKQALQEIESSLLRMIEVLNTKLAAPYLTVLVLAKLAAVGAYALDVQRDQFLVAIAAFYDRAKVLDASLTASN